VQRICEATERLAAQIADSTVSDVLREIDDALETRMK
jgi:hypothetical protein